MRKANAGGIAVRVRDFIRQVKQECGRERGMGIKRIKRDEGLEP